ncbi:13178_t:CDS:1 [Ambispora gerdemannii]|uniref:13178_t:CDS:1 n=1 Tax=Ambispora gerdemannii TaxID=144530 RepID=A0A9N9EKS8_9GLOM|nr:13178_t:CDS:1 [Ambispora gerdemannii]
MPLFQENKQNTQQQNNTQAQNSQTQNQTNTQSAQTQNQPEQTKSQSGLMTIIGQCLPFAPLVFEQFTGQKVPAISGTMAEIQLALSQIQVSQQQLLTSQQQLTQRITNLEVNASQQLTNLSQQFQSLRLTHTRERKEIEYNNPNTIKETEEY